MSTARLVTYASLRELASSAYSVNLQHVACLPDGREILLDDRGFSASATFGIGLTRDEVELPARRCVSRTCD